MTEWTLQSMPQALAVPHAMRLQDVGEETIPWADLEEPGGSIDGAPLARVRFTDLSQQRAPITARESFFHLSHHDVPRIDVNDWSLSFAGRLGRRASLHLKELARLEKTDICSVECHDVWSHTDQVREPGAHAPRHPPLGVHEVGGRRFPLASDLGRLGSHEIGRGDRSPGGSRRFHHGAGGLVTVR